MIGNEYGRAKAGFSEQYINTESKYDTQNILNLKTDSDGGEYTTNQSLLHNHKSEKTIGLK